jgi:hypothetical protein
VKRHSFDSSHVIAHANPAHSENRLGNHKVARLNATKVQPLDSTGEGILATRRVTAKRGLSAFWGAVVECFIEGFALYGASIHPSDYRVPHGRAQTRQAKPAQAAGSQGLPVQRLGKCRKT